MEIKIAEPFRMQRNIKDISLGKKQEGAI